MVVKSCKVVRGGESFLGKQGLNGKPTVRPA